MRKFVLAGVVFASMAAVGCDQTLSSSERTTRNPDGSQSTTEQKTVQHPDGSVTTEKNVRQNNSPY